MSKQRAAIIILGATGDLAKRKLIPALELLHQQNRMEYPTMIVGSGRKELSHQEFRERFDASEDFKSHLYYHRGIPGLRSFLKEMGHFCRVIIFMALPPETYASTAEALADEGFGNRSPEGLPCDGMSPEGEQTFLIIEKPFGRDYDSARELNRSLTARFDEQFIFRSDHYLAKEAVQNILIFRFANSIFEPSWNNRYIESIQISAFEEIGVEDRGAYYDTAGSLRDMIQNHLFQLLCLITMEPPVSLNSEDIRTQKINILKTLKVESIHRGQYEGYTSEQGVAPDSRTETFTEMKLRIDNYRWAGVPIYIRTGKSMDRKGTEIGLKLRPVPRILFNEKGRIDPNQVIIKVQPAEGIILDLAGKIPGMNVEIVNTNMSFCYRETFGGQQIPEAYQKLLQDALRGDRTLFVSAEETETSWQVIGPWLDRGDLTSYPRGTVPPSAYGDIWIDFSRYEHFCLD